MLFTVATWDPFLLDNDQCGVVEANSIKEAADQVRTWLEAHLKNVADEYTFEEMFSLPGDDEYAITVKTHDNNGHKGEDTLVIRPAKSPLMFMSEDWDSVFA